MPSLSLIPILIYREIVGRYRGSLLGILWSLITPLCMLAVYTFAFGFIFQARWGGAEGAASTGSFSLNLFAGLIIFQFFSEVINRAPLLILTNQNYVKKVIFPLEILAPVALGSALFHALISFIVLLVFIPFVFDGIPLTALMLPLVLVPLSLLILGLSWFLASFGVYVRDVSQSLSTIVTACLFLSPVFYPITMLPEWARFWIRLNPITIPVEQSRNVLIQGIVPDLSIMALYTLIAVAFAAFGYLWFQKTRKGFADVI
jgi:lipopolysaccharide transport system permease protein